MKDFKIMFMVTRVLSGGLWGIDAFPVEVEIDMGRGLPSFTIVGLPEGAVREARERVKSALKNCGFEIPLKRIIVNLAPADVRKEGSFYDLPIALGILAGSKVFNPDVLKDFAVVGELSLDGEMKRIRGGLSFAISALSWGVQSLILPISSAREASAVEKIRAYGFENLPQCITFLRGDASFSPVKCEDSADDGYNYSVDINDVRGQFHAKRALEISAAGGHNVLMIGPPGAGKTMLARRLPTILPPLTFDEKVEVTRVYSVKGLTSGRLVQTRPFRAPHHTISDVGMIGGGNPPSPGEVSLAHTGVLFLDEFPEFDRNVIDSLRGPVEDGEVCVVRAARAVIYPARFILVSAMNPCPCGYLGDNKKECRCTSKEIRRYRRKLSGPILDRFDIQVEVPPLDYIQISEENKGESSSEVRERVMMARRRQIERFGGVMWNSRMGPKEIKKFCDVNNVGREILLKAVEKLGLSARAYFKVLKVSRTIADLEGSERIESHHIAEALQFRLTRGELLY